MGNTQFNIDAHKPIQSRKTGDLLFKFYIPGDSAGSDSLMTHWKDIQGEVSESEQLMDFLNQNIYETVEAVQNSINGLSDKIDNRLSQIQGEIQNTENQLTDIVNRNVNSMNERVDALTNKVDTTITGLEDYIKEYLQEELPNMDLSGLDFSNYLKVDDASRIYMSKDDADKLKQDILQIVTDDIDYNEQVIKEWVLNKHYLTEHQSLENYYDKDHIDSSYIALDEKIKDIKPVINPDDIINAVD